MALKAVLDSLDDTPEALREAYTQGDDGRFYLDAEGVDDLPTVRGLKTAFEKTKRDAKAAADALRKYDGLDPEEYARLKTAAEEAETAKLQGEGKWEEMKKRLSDAHAKELEKWGGEVAKRDRVIEQLTVENELSAAIEKVNILPEHRKAVRALLKMEAAPKVVWEEDAARGLMGDVSIAEYVESWAKTDEAAPYLPSSGANGSGAKGGGGGGTGGVRSKKDFASAAERAAYIGKHGSEAYLALPDE